MRIQVMFFASVMAGGCGFSSSAKPTDAHGIDTPMHDGSADAAVDAPPDAPQQDFGTGTWTVHVPTLPTAGVTITGAIDTSVSSTDCSSNAAWVDSSQPDACFIVGTTIDTSNNVTVHGTRPLVLVATDAITIDKNIDLASKRGMTPGPAADWSGCASLTAGANRTTGGGGGAGGTYITAGGTGGAGDNGQGLGSLASNTLLGAPAILHGGCPGSDGGTGSQGARSTAGSGGGAIYVVAAHTITITAFINASGAGVTGGGHQSGGGGGGSGGTIVLYAPAITATGAKLVANGGGGAGGGVDNNPGAMGGDPMPANPATQAPGGNGPGGNGGDGYSTAGIGAAGTIGGGTEGGGGGGGGAGYIRSNVTLTGAIASPAVDVVP